MGDMDFDIGSSFRFCPPYGILSGTDRRSCSIHGRWVASKSERTFQTLDPATGEPLRPCTRSGRGGCGRSGPFVRKALEGSWSRISPAERGPASLEVGGSDRGAAEELCQLESLDTGKPLTETSAADIPLTVEQFRYFAGWATKLTGDVLPVSFPGSYLAYTRREPVGVVGAIVPWNFPLLIASWKLAPALAGGNTVVLKPSEITPLTAIRSGS